MITKLSGIGFVLLLMLGSAHGGQAKDPPVPSCLGVPKDQCAAFAKIAPTIRSAGLMCTWVSGVTDYDWTERGKLYKVYCDDALIYRLLVTPDKKVIIRPWRE